MAHDIWIQLAETLTGSSNVTVILALLITPGLPLVGETPSTSGDRSPESEHTCNVVALLRGLGELAVKSWTLLSVSLQPPRLRKSAAVLPNNGAAAEPSKHTAAPYPTK